MAKHIAWEDGDTAARWTPGLNDVIADVVVAGVAGAIIETVTATVSDYAPDQRITDVWRVVYYQGRYWHCNVKRTSGYRYKTMNHTLRGAFVNAPFMTGWRSEGQTGVMPFTWYGDRLASIQTFTWDKA